MNHGRGLDAASMLPASQLSAAWVCPFCPFLLPIRHFGLPLARFFQNIPETQTFVDNIRADDLKRPLTAARSQRPLLNKPALFWTFFFSQTEYLHTVSKPHKRSSADNIFMQAVESGREKSLLIGVTALALLQEEQSGLDLVACRLLLNSSGYSLTNNNKNVNGRTDMD